MKLKKLEIIGFKSFHEKASIGFPPGVSAVVGPNGCGKSNIVDALMWVMGEQSVKQLRGKNMEDVIFAGGGGRPPTNLAEVSLTLANDNGNAPEELKDYSEIMVTRRLYRSGESAYLINKRPCRLKDIHNIFMGSGMGAKAYSVIQQGNIGAITDAGPEERRVFIEEAAGITRYKVRKVETLRKIDATNQNLLRVNDIIAEVARQMNGLKRQAKKAERYKVFQERMAALDTRLLLHCDNDLADQIRETQVMLSQLQDTDMAHDTQLKQIDAAIEQIKLRRHEKNQEIAVQKNQKFESQRHIDRLETDLAHFKSNVDRLGHEVQELENARTTLEEKIATIQDEMTQVQTRSETLASESAVIKAQLSTERDDSQNLRNRLTSLNQQLDEQKNALMRLVADEARFKNIYQTAESNRENLQRRLKRMDEEVALATQQEQRTAAQRSEAEAQLAELQRSIENLEGSVASSRQTLDEHTAQLGRQVKQTQILELQRNKVRSKWATLKKMADNYEWYKGGVKAIMKAVAPSDPAADPADQPESALTANIIGLVADQIEPAPEYETAVEAVLGETLQYILVADQPSAINAIAYLKDCNAGRSGFIPVDSVPAVAAAPTSPADSARRLLNHLQIRPGYEPICESLLGHVIVADSLEEGLALFNRNGNHQTVVTKSGEVIAHQGAMVGGSQENLSGILAKKQELKQLAQRSADLDQRLEASRTRQKEVEAQVRQSEIGLQQLMVQRSEAKQEEIEIEKQLYKLSEDLKNARRHLEIVRLEQEQLLGEESDMGDEMQRYNQALAKVTEEVEQAQRAAEATTRQIEMVSDQLEAFNQKMVDLKLKLTAANAELENSDHTLKRLSEFQKDGVTRLETLVAEIVQKADKRQTLKRRIDEYQQRLTGLISEMNQIEAVLAASESDYSAIDAELAKNDSLINEIRNQREAILKRIRVLELELSELRIKRDNLGEKCIERYHMRIDQLRQQLAQPSESEPMSIEEMEQRIERLKHKIARIGDVNMSAIEEYKLLKERHDFLTTQRDDLVQAIEDLHKVIRKINRITQEKFLSTFHAVNDKLIEVFPKLFMGGSAHLALTDPDKPLETGVEYLIHPAGKKLTRMSLLSGGEKALAAISFIFSIFLLKPASFCLMDEIDAPLDDANVHRFNELLKFIGEKSQIIMITHNKRTMEFADMLFGVTMEQKGISKIVSVNLSHHETAPQAA